jgi:hypothetical protein
MVKYFAERQFEDFVIKDGHNRKVGTLRVRPTSLLWASLGKHAWKGVSTEQFAEFIRTEGKPRRY